MADSFTLLSFTALSFTVPAAAAPSRSGRTLDKPRTLDKG